MPARKPKTQQTISTTNIKEEMKQTTTPSENIKKEQVNQVEAPVKELANITENTMTEQPLDSTLSNEVSSKETETIEKHFDNLYLTLTAFKQSIATMNQHIKILERDMKKELRVLRKVNSKQKLKGNRKPSGFAKPSDVSVELCAFMNREKGTQIARTEVTQYLISYIKEHQLQFAENKKVILPDEKLKKLLNVDDKTEVTYFNLQGLMNKHFVHN
tara:strand:- start:302 stop:949 length:648 start_codon:yes stop_codon:yes gene_type:complete